MAWHAAVLKVSVCLLPKTDDASDDMHTEIEPVLCRWASSQT